MKEHEVIHAASIIKDIFGVYVYDREESHATEELSRMAAAVESAMSDFYNALLDHYETEK